MSSNFGNTSIDTKSTNIYTNIFVLLKMKTIMTSFQTVSVIADGARFIKMFRKYFLVYLLYFIPAFSAMFFIAFSEISNIARY